jgi:hypothetical protein
MNAVVILHPNESGHTHKIKSHFSHTRLGSLLRLFNCARNATDNSPFDTHLCLAVKDPAQAEASSPHWCGFAGRARSSSGKYLLLQPTALE